MRVATADELQAIGELLEVNGLPADDLAEQNLSLFRIAGAPGSVDAVGGLERCGDNALIRSIATSKTMQGLGIASEIVQELEELALNKGIRGLYLLTESAELYFQSKGYSQIERTDVPLSIRESRQFSALCPDSATVMFKRVGV